MLSKMSAGAERKWVIYFWVTSSWVCWIKVLQSKERINNASQREWIENKIWAQMRSVLESWWQVQGTGRQHWRRWQKGSWATTSPERQIIASPRQKNCIYKIKEASIFESKIQESSPWPWPRICAAFVNTPHLVVHSILKGCPSQVRY